MDLFELPVEVLLKIILYLDDKTLISLRFVCKSFKKVVDNDHLWQKKFQKLTIFNPLWPDFCNYTWKTNYVSCQSWRRKIPKRVWRIDYKRKCLPWLQVSENTLYISRGSIIECRRLKNSEHRKHRTYVFSVSTWNDFDDVGRFVVSNSEIYAGTISGQLCVWKKQISNNYSRRKVPDHCFQAHTSDVHCVALASATTLISGSRDGHLKFWNRQTNSNDDYDFSLTADTLLDDRIWSMHVEESNQRLLSVGSAACKNSCAPLSVLDIEQCAVVSQFGLPARRGAGISDVKFRNESTLLACGYDSTIRLYDTRSNKCEWSWWEKYDSNIFCLETDKNNSIVVGTSRHGLVWFLDLRWKRPVSREFFTTSRNSPVYSLAANTQTLFVCLDSELHEFSVNLENDHFY